MEKFIKITENPDKKVTIETQGFNLFEIIGLLTYYRDKIETDAMFPEPKKE
jgi:hypothetical protein